MVGAAPIAILSRDAPAVGRSVPTVDTGDLLQMVVWGFVLLIIFVAASYAIVRFSRRYRAYLLRRPAPPTASDDVWSQHRVDVPPREEEGP